MLKMDDSCSSSGESHSAGDDVQLGKRQRKRSTKYDEDSRKEQQFIASMKNSK